LIDKKIGAEGKTFRSFLWMEVILKRSKRVTIAYFSLGFADIQVSK